MQIGVQHICRSTLCGTRVVLAAPDRDTAQWWADSLGRSEVEEVAEGYSYGANTIRDGVSLTPRRELRTLALPSEIMRLANLEGYLKFPGPFPVASIKLKYVARPAAAERFVPREGGGAPEDRASGAAMPGANDAMTVPDTVGPGEIRGDPSKARADAPDRVPYRGEPKFVPLPGEAASAEAAPGRIADGGPGGKNGWRKARPFRGAQGRTTGRRGRCVGLGIAGGRNGGGRAWGGRRTSAGGSDMRSIGARSSAAQGASYYERDGYYAKDDPEHRAASAWHGRGGRRARPDLDALGMGAAELARRVE